MGTTGAETLGGTPMSICLYIHDVDSSSKTIAVGTTEVCPLSDQFYGDHPRTLTDHYGQTGTIATHIEDLSQKEIQRRMEAMLGG